MHRIPALLFWLMPLSAFSSDGEPEPIPSIYLNVSVLEAAEDGTNRLIILGSDGNTELALSGESGSPRELSNIEAIQEKATAIRFKTGGSATATIGEIIPFDETGRRLKPSADSEPTNALFAGFRFSVSGEVDARGAIFLQPRVEYIDFQGYAEFRHLTDDGAQELLYRPVVVGYTVASTLVVQNGQTVAMGDLSSIASVSPYKLILITATTDAQDLIDSAFIKRLLDLCASS